MPTHCAIFGCSNKTSNKKISFYRFPKLKINAASDLKMKMKKQRNAWLKSLCRRDNIADTNIDYMRVCSIHFKSGKPASYHNEKDPDWCPTLNMDYNVSSEIDMANDNPEDLKDCKRPGPSANPEPTATDINDLIQENAEKIRVGRDYQAVIPKLLVLPKHRRERLNKRALLVWAPTENISEDKLSEYILISKEKFGYNSEQALGMLFWHNHDMDKALSDLSNFAPLPDDWSAEDKVTFEGAFNNIGKNFLRIKQLMPDKPIASLVKYYYLWKNKRKKNSHIDRQAKKLEKARLTENSQNGSRDGSSSAESEPDEKGET